jgi:multiple sugar transport system permease protein
MLKITKYQPITRYQKRKRFELAPYLFVLPAILFIILLAIIPILYSLVISFQSYRLGAPESAIRFNGLDNYIKILSNPTFIGSIGWTFTFAFIAVSVNLILGLSVALVLNHRIMQKGLKIFRSFFILPLMLAPVVSAIMWKVLFAAIYGPVNYVISLLGLPSVSWIGEELPAKIAILVIDIWSSTPFCVLIFLAAFQTIPTDLIEAATIDGARKSTILFRVSLPIIRNFIALIVSIRVMDALRVFDSVIVFTNGGPGNSTETIGTVIYKTAFRYADIGGGSAGAFIFFVIIVVFTLIFLKLSSRNVEI